MLHFKVEGSGPPLLLIHGWGVTFAIWQNLKPLLLPHFQLIMIELPGVGDSPEVEADRPYYSACAEALEEVRQELEIEQWAILAYSSGTRAGEAYVQCYPQRVSRIVFLCPIYLTELVSLGLRAQAQLDHVRPELADWILADWRLYTLILMLAFNGRRHTYTDEWMHEIKMQPMSHLKRQIYELPGRGRTRFTASSVPSLFVWGRHDVLTARPLRPRPNDVFLSANHSAPVMAAADVAEAVLPFLLKGQLAAQHSRRGPLKAISLIEKRARKINPRALIRNRRGRSEV
jgi:pimeloyl-ACP methyl ester carboxylesterase